MANFVSLRPQATRNYAETSFLGQQAQSQAQPQAYDSRSNNSYNAKPYLNLNPTSPLLLNMSQNKYRSPKEHEDQLRFKEKSLLGNSYVHDSSFKQISNLKPYEDDNYKNNGFSTGVRPKQEVKSFLSQLSHITNSPNSIDWSKRQENNNTSTSKPQAGMSRLWRDPAEDKVQKNQKIDEWKQILAAQVQARQMEKQKKIEYERAQDVREEEKYKKHLEEQASSPPPYQAERHFNKAPSLHLSSTLHQRNISVSPPHNMHSQTPKNSVQYDAFSPQKKGPDRKDNHNYKSPFTSGPSLPTLQLNSYIDQLKSEILQSQKVFMEQMKGLKEEVDKSRQVKTLTEKHLLLPSPTKDYAMRIEADPLDILDNYVHTYNPNQNYYGHKQNNIRNRDHNDYNNNQSPNKYLRERAESSKGQGFRSNLIHHMTSFNQQPKSTALEEEDQGINLDLATSPGGMIVGVKGKFVDINENVVLERESVIKNNRSGIRTQDDFNKVRRQSIEAFKSEKVLPSDSDEKESPAGSKQASIDLEAKENAEKKKKNKGNKENKDNKDNEDNEENNKDNKDSRNRGNKKIKNKESGESEEELSSQEEVEEDIARSERLQWNEGGESEKSEEESVLNGQQTSVKKKKKGAKPSVKEQLEQPIQPMQPMNFIEKLEIELEEIDNPKGDEHAEKEKKGGETAKGGENGTEEKKEEKNLKRIWLEAAKPDNENMFDYMSSVFVDTKDVDTMEDLKDYKRVNRTENKLMVETNQPTEYMKRKNIGSVEIVDEEPARPTDLMNKEEREQYKRRDLKRGTAAMGQEPTDKTDAKKIAQRKSVVIKKRI